MVRREAPYTNMRLDHFVVFFDEILLHLVQTAGFRLYHESPRFNGARHFASLGSGKCRRRVPRKGQDQAGDMPC